MLDQIASQIARDPALFGLMAAAIAASALAAVAGVSALVMDARRNQES